MRARTLFLLLVLPFLVGCAAGRKPTWNVLFTLQADSQLDEHNKVSAKVEFKRAVAEPAKPTAKS